MRNCILTLLATIMLLAVGCEQEKGVERDRDGSPPPASETTQVEETPAAEHDGEQAAAGVIDAASNAAGVALDGMGDEAAVPGIDAFLWKPVSESDGCAVALFPAKYRTDRIVQVHIEGGARDGETPLLVYWPDGHNGNRVHARWGAAGSAYGKNFKVVAVLVTGRHMNWLVRDGGGRQEM